MVIKVNCWSRYKCLDVMDFKVMVGDDMSGTEVDAGSYSTGIAPLILPPIFGVLASAVRNWVD